MGRRGPIGRLTTGLRLPDGMMTVPECPAELSKPARRHWDRLSKVLLELGVLTVADGMALADLCELMADRDSLRRAAKQIRGADRKRLAALRLIVNLDAAIKRRMDGFGLDPSSRARLHIPAGESAGILDVDAYAARKPRPYGPSQQ